MSDEGSSAPQPAAEQVEKKEEDSAAPENTASDATAPSAAKSEPSNEEAVAPAPSNDDDVETKKAEAPKERSSADAVKEASKEDADAAGADTDSKPVEDTAEASKEEPDSEMNDADATEAPTASDPAAGDDSVVADDVATPSGDKSKGRRKSSATPAKNKKLNKKASKVFHLTAEPGDHFLVKLKGYPQWPVIIADEEMLPEQLIKSRPVTAKRSDGTYREDYAEGGKRANDRTFPVMYLRTNEFGWVPNSALQELPSDRAQELLTDKVKKKELREAFELAIEANSLDHYKEELQAHQQRQEEKLRAKKEASQKKIRRQSAAAAKDEDVEMDDAADEPEEKPKSVRKRKAEEAATPQRSDSAKKPKIKLTTSSTPKTANGTSTPKSSKDSAKPKAKSKNKPDENKKEEPQLTPEEAHERKTKEVLFLRHKLQKGLLAREGIPKEDEMKSMSEYISKLENLPDLEVSIIRTTKINKVLKAILKLESIPKESEFNFKPRSQALLDKWTKILNSGEGASAAPASGANGVNGSDEKKTESTPAVADANGVNDSEKSEKADKDESAPAEDKPAEETNENAAGREDDD